MKEVLDIFQGIVNFFGPDFSTVSVRLLLLFIGGFFIYGGYKKFFEPLIMIPMGLGICLVNTGLLVMPDGKVGNLFVNALAEKPDEIINAIQVYFLQPVYTLTFSNGLIACLIFMGIGVMTEIDYLLKRPFYSFFLAISAELGTFLTLPIANLLGFNLRDSASIAMIGGADGPIVIYTSITLSPKLFVAITVVGYLYLSIVYALYPYMIKALIPKKLIGIEMVELSEKKISAGQKFAFSGIICVLFSLLFPTASPLIGSFFLGVIIREAGVERYKRFMEDTLLSGSTLFLGFTLGALLSTEIVLNREVLLILILGIIALILSGLGGLFGGYVLYKLTKGKINPVLGIAGVSCVPTTAKVAQKCASEANPRAVIIEYAMGANVAGVITTAIICACYISLLK